MGWCSGTELFDIVVKQVLSEDIPEDAKERIIDSLVNGMFILDWDCEDDSDYRKHPLVKKVIKNRTVTWND